MIDREQDTTRSLAKLMTPGAPWKGLGENQAYYNGTTPDTSPTGGALIVDQQTNWPVAAVKPRTLRPHSENGDVDKTGVVYNAFSVEDAERKVIIRRLVDTTSGSENEVRLLGIRNTPALKKKVQKKLEQENIGGYTTWEIAADMMEANRKVVRGASLANIQYGVEQQNQAIVEVVEEDNAETGQNGRIIMVSARPNFDPDVEPPDDIYVIAMVDLLADGSINTESPGVLAWMAHSSHAMLDNLSPEEIAERIKSGDKDFAKKAAMEFDASALHDHTGMVDEEQTNPNFYAAFLNKEMGVLGPMLGVTTFSGPFRNSTYSKAHELKQFVRPWFKTAGYQAAYKEMGSEAYLEEANRNITEGAASSLTRAGVTGDKSHGETRVRTEPFRTAERLYGSAHPLSETEALYSFSGNVNAAILSHYHITGVEIDIPEPGKRYFSDPDEMRYNINRQQIGAHGQFANIIDGRGEVTSYRDFMLGYAEFVEAQIRNLGIETSQFTRRDGSQVDEIEEFTDRIRRVVDTPEEGWNIDHYMDPDHPDYAKGTLSTHLIAELAVRVTGDDRWRTSYKDEEGEWKEFNDYDSARDWWKSVTREIPEGRYDEEIQEITSHLADLTHDRYRDKNK